ncbi:MAG: HAMP domain-containing histidine kinase [Oscillospiraceae bacterium]|jgi:signal transduction histidine kinase|nr:HAMP domain-containing histidine kinase [Oscillospiraceae bacterium]
MNYKAQKKKTKNPAIRASLLFRKYFTTFMVILLVGFTILGSVLMIFSMQFWTRDKLSLLLANAAQAAHLVSGIYAQSPDGTLDMTRQMMVSAVLVSNSSNLGADFFLCDTNGRVVACQEDVPDALRLSLVQCNIHGVLRLPKEEAQAAMQGEYTQTGNLDDSFEHMMLLAAEPYFVQGQPAGFVMAAQELSQGLFNYIFGILRLFLLSSLVVAVLMFVAVYFIATNLVRPLIGIMRATETYAKGDFGYRVEAQEDSELNKLAQAFNSMAISLAALEESRRSFVANVSHELKTPMTTIGGFIDGMIDGTVPPAQHQKYFAVVSGEIRRLSRLVTGMLNLSKIEAGELQMKHEPLDISELIFTTVLSFEQIMQRKALTLAGLEGLESMVLFGDKDLLTQVFYNLIDNAVKFTPQGGRLTFFAQQDKKGFHFRLRNTGTGVAAEELSRIFERFYKTDKSRSYDTKGAGLGLYLVKTIITMHGGSVAAESDGATFMTFSVTLPTQEGKETT